MHQRLCVNLNYVTRYKLCRIDYVLNQTQFALPVSSTIVFKTNN